MPSVFSAILFTALFGLSVNAQCGDNGGAELGWGSQAEADANGANVRTALGFNSKGPFDAAGNPILSVISINSGYDSSFYAFSAFICGQYSPDNYPQTTYGPVISAAETSIAQCLTVSELEAANATISLQPCVNDISANPVATQMFEWIGTNYVTYGFAFIGAQSPLPINPSNSTDYTPSIVGSLNKTGGYVRLDYTPGGLPPSTGLETGLILELSDD
ncbi:hypothetical protein B0H11DRAFT_2216266 [Mycena galericulata]|nr:hypothetical protein B0H11DRAFT_2216266 [Mycena galericulata]